MRRVLINADDFGINPVVTKETIRLIESGTISSATIMANGACLEDVKSAFVNFPNVSFGIHLCLTEFRSITAPRIFYDNGLIDSNGFFIKKSIFNCEHFSDELIIAIKKELSAQIEKVLSLGVKISHADSHHLSHTSIYGLQDMIVSLLHEYDIHKIRISNGINVPQIVWNNIRRKLKSENSGFQKEYMSENKGLVTNSHHGYLYRVNRLIKQTEQQASIIKLYRKNFVTTDKFASVGEFAESKIRLGKDESIELMCHPGHTNPNYIKEINDLESNKLSDLYNFKLISYNDL